MRDNNGNDKKMLGYNKDDPNANIGNISTDISPEKNQIQSSTANN